MYRKITTEAMSRAIELYKSGLSTIKVSTITGISLSTLQNKFKKLNITRSLSEANIRWTMESMQKAIQFYEAGHNLSEASNLTGISTHSIRRELQSNKQAVEKHKWSVKKQKIPKLEEAITLYKSGMPMLQVASQTGICMATLQSNLKLLGLSRSNKENSRKYYVNHDFFEIIDTIKKAYWLGFIYADGYVTRVQYGKRVGIAINEKDEKHLEKLKHALDSTYPINHYVNRSNFGTASYVRLLMASEKMFDDLNQHGATERKSLTLTFPNENIVPNHLISHFVRGYFDGDGSFSKCGKITNGMYHIKICGTKAFLETLAKLFDCESLKLQKRHKNDINDFSLDIGGSRQVIRIANYMYQDSTSETRLTRKYRRYCKMLKKYS